MRHRIRALLVGWLVCVGCGSESPLGPSQADGPRSAPAAGAPERAGKERGDAPTGPAPPVLYDARERTKVPLGVEREPKLSPELEQLVYGVISPNRKARREDCQGPDDVIVRATASATGAFTAPATKQVAYVVVAETCGAADADETAHLVVVEGEKVVLHGSGTGEAPSFSGTDIRAVVDLDQDGASELLVTSESGAEEFARLYAAVGGQLKAVGEFPGVYVDGCAAGPNGQARAQVVHYRAGAKNGAGRFSTEAYQAPCPASGAPSLADFQPFKPPVPASSPSSSPEPSSEPSPKP